MEGGFDDLALAFVTIDSNLFGVDHLALALGMTRLRSDAASFWDAKPLVWLDRPGFERTLIYGPGVILILRCRRERHAATCTRRWP
jgi:hypothetical protein